MVGSTGSLQMAFSDLLQTPDLLFCCGSNELFPSCAPRQAAAPALLPAGSAASGLAQGGHAQRTHRGSR